MKRKKVNPLVIRVAMQNIRRELAGFRIFLFMRDEGEDVRDCLTIIGQQITVLASCLEKLGETDSPDYRKLKSAMVVLGQIVERGFKWRKADAITLDNALEIFDRRVAKLPVPLLVEGWLALV